MPPRNSRVSAASISARLQTHEAVCAERYGAIEKALGEIRKFLTRATFGLITGLFVALGTILFTIAKSKGLL